MRCKQQPSCSLHKSAGHYGCTAWAISSYCSERASITCIVKLASHCLHQERQGWWYDTSTNVCYVGAALACLHSTVCHCPATCGLHTKEGSEWGLL